MYTSFRVQNFRCFRDLRLDDLGRVNLIAGRNNSGKTALLEAIYLHTRPLSPQVLFDLQQTRGLNVPDGSMAIYWKQFFYGMDSTNPIIIKGALSSQCTKLRITELPYSEDNAKSFSTYFRNLIAHGRIKLPENGDTILELTLIDDEERNVYVAPNLPMYPNKDAEQRSSFIPVHGRPDKRTVADQFSQLEMSGELPKLIKALRIFEPQLNDLRLLSPDSEIIIWARINGSRMPLRLMGEGINQVSHFILTMMTNPKSCLFIDEIENGLHYTIQKDVWKVIGQIARDLDIQVFATTHSLEMIRAAHEAFKDDAPYDFRYHRLDRDSITGDIEAVTYNQFGMEAVVSIDYEVRG